MRVVSFCDVFSRGGAGSPPKRLLLHSQPALPAPPHSGLISPIPSPADCQVQLPAVPGNLRAVVLGTSTPNGGGQAVQAASGATTSSEGISN
eukprot:1184350-Prorocentrum_minimum.AAC.2